MQRTNSSFVTKSSVNKFVKCNNIIRIKHACFTILFVVSYELFTCLCVLMVLKFKCIIGICFVPSPAPQLSSKCFTDIFRIHAVMTFLVPVRRLWAAVVF